MKLVQLATAFLLAVAGFGSAQAQSNEDFLTIQLKDGPVVIQLMPDVAPKHVAQIKDLAAKGEYDNVAFHRVIEGFMAQTGDVQYGKGADLSMAGMGGSDLPDVKAEFNAEHFVRGVVGAARTQDPDTFNSQFFICFQDCTFLDGQYTVFGKVVEGMDVVDAITRGEPPANPDKIVSARIEQK